MSIVTGTICVLGHYGIGKTSLIKKYLFKEFGKNIESTIGASIFSKFIKRDTFSVHATFWDTAGQEQYAPLIPMYTRSADVLLCCVELSVEDTISYIEKNIENIISSRIKNPPSVLYIVATKIDLEKNKKNSVKKTNDLFKFIKEILDKHNLEDKIHLGVYFTSSLSNYNVSELFYECLEQVYNNKTIYYQKKESIILEENEKMIEERNKKCCKLY